MKITGARVFSVDLPYEIGEWRFALGTTRALQGLMLRLDTDTGRTGWGYTHAVNHLGDAKGSIRWVLEHLFTPFLVDQDPFDLEGILQGLNRIIALNARAKAAVDLALHDLISQDLGVPLYRYLGGKMRDRIDVIKIVPLKEPESEAEFAQGLVNQGFRHLKVKLDGHLQTDVERVKLIRETVGGAITITVDANQQYDVQTAIRAIRLMERYDVYLVEQPVRYDDILGLREVTRNVNVLVEADESAQSLGDIMNVIRLEAASSISLKVPKLGGIQNTKRAAAICAAANMTCRIGAAVGSRLFAAANMHIIASTANLGFPAEAGEFYGLLNDPVHGIEVENGQIMVPDAIGMGVQVHEAELDPE